MPRPGGGGPPAPGPMPPGGPAPPQMQRPGMLPGGAPAQGGPPMGQNGAGMRPPGGQQLDWRQLVQAVQQSNPNIKPDVLAEAVNQFLPMMNAQSQQEWRMVSLQIREQALQQREQQFMLAEQGRNTRASESADTRRDVAETGAAARRDVAQTGAASRESIADKNRVSRETIARMTVDERREAMEAGLVTRQEIADAMIASREREGAANRGSREENQALNREQRGDQFQQREHRLEQALDLRSDATWERLEQQKQAAMERAEQNKWKQGVAEVKTLIDEQDKHIRTKIAASNILSATQRKKMLEEADKVNAEQLTAMRTRAKGGSSAPAGQTDQPPAEALKEGQVTTFENGQKWTLKGGKPERVP